MKKLKAFIYRVWRFLCSIGRNFKDVLLTNHGDIEKWG